METISNYQKKLIGTCLLIILVLTTIAGFVVYCYGVYFDFDWAKILGVATNFLSPTTIIGVVIKFFMNQQHIKKVKKETKEIKMFFKKENKPTSIYTRYDINGFIFEIKDKGEIIIKFNKDDFLNEGDFYNKFRVANGEFTEQMRKILNKEI